MRATEKHSSSGRIYKGRARARLLWYNPSCCQRDRTLVAESSVVVARPLSEPYPSPQLSMPRPPRRKATYSWAGEHITRVLRFHITLPSSLYSYRPLIIHNTPLLCLTGTLGHPV